MKQPIRFISMLLFLMLAAVGSAWSAEAGDDEACASCHDELAAQLAATAHGLSQRGAPGCKACHGDGTAHMDAGGDKAKISKPAGAKGEAACRACHTALQDRVLPSGAAHPSGSVYCFDCHSVHGSKATDRALLTARPSDLCLTCHADQKAAFARPYGHNLENGGIRCVSCHNPHAGKGEKSLKLDHAGQGPCVTCHAEKRGPFVFAHAGDKAGSCMSCHEPHGSVKPSALTRTNVYQLCLECHSPTAGGTLGSQPPSIHDLRSPRYRDCTVCHVAIHGSNSSALFLK
jgi:DmsE family decaheme c-type cytochrome